MNTKFQIVDFRFQISIQEFRFNVQIFERFSEFKIDSNLKSAF